MNKEKAHKSCEHAAELRGVGSDSLKVDLHRTIIIKLYDFNLYFQNHLSVIFKPGVWSMPGGGQESEV